MMKMLSLNEDPVDALDRFEQLIGARRRRLGRFLVQLTSLLAVGRYCRYRHLSLGDQARYQCKLMDRENHHEH